MRIGISLSSRAEPGQIVERARLAHEVGLESLSVGDHHNMNVPYAQNTPILGRLLADWTERPAGCLFLLPLWHPLIAAEHIGTLAATHDGPFFVQTGLGYGAEQFAALGAKLSTRGRMLDESVRVISALLAGEVVDSELYGIVGGMVGLRPPQPVDWWIGGSAQASVTRAGALGAVWYASPAQTPDSAAGLLDSYRQACEASSSTPRPVIRRDALVLADGRRAHQRADEIIAAGYRGLQKHQLLVGSADEVGEQVAVLAASGFIEVVTRCMSTDQGESLETIEQLGVANAEVRKADVRP